MSGWVVFGGGWVALGWLVFCVVVGVVGCWGGWLGIWLGGCLLGVFGWRLGGYWLVGLLLGWLVVGVVGWLGGWVVVGVELL